MAGATIICVATVAHVVVVVMLLDVVITASVATRIVAAAAAVITAILLCLTLLARGLSTLATLAIVLFASNLLDLILALSVFALSILTARQRG